MTDALAELLACFDSSLPLAQARTIPASWYHSPIFHQAECSDVFGNTWQAVGRAEQVASPGQFFTVEIAGEPIVIVRDRERRLHAFYNVCRHRAARVVPESAGECSKLRCRYHGWTYDLAGRLRGTPEFDGVADFDRDNHGLIPLAVAIWGPFVWVHGGPVHRTLDQWLDPLTRRGLLPRLEGLRFVARKEYRLACNWKVYVDNYLDGGYHVNTVHPGLAGVLDYAQYRSEIDDHISLQLSPLTAASAESVASVRQGDQALYAWVFPNFMLNLYHGVMDTNLVLPDGPNACRVLFDFYFAETESSEARDFIARSIAVAEQIQQEDVDICEEVQRGLHSRSFETGRFSVRREATGYHFHQLLAQWLRGGRS